MSENLLLARRTIPQQRTVPRIPTPPLRDVPRFDTPLPILPPHPAIQSEFAERNSPTDLVFRALWQLVGAYVFVVLLVKDRRLPR